MRIKRKIAKDSWKVNLPSEIMNELGWKKGDEIIFESENGKVIISNAEDKEENEEDKDDSKHYSNGKKIPSKKTPCGFYEFTKQKYVDNKCDKCNKSEMFFKNGISCPLAEKETENIAKEIAKNIDNERRIDKKDIELIKTKLDTNQEDKLSFIKKKLERLNERYNRLSKNKISFLSHMNQLEKQEYLHQTRCGMCKQPMIEHSNIIKNDKLICKNCRKLLISEIQEVIYLKKEINKLEGEINGRYRNPGKNGNS